jgi:hypothetical protein
VDWEKYTGKKSAAVETRGPLHVVDVKKKDQTWEIVSPDHVRLTPVDTGRTLNIQAQEDLEVYVGTDKVWPLVSDYPSFDEVWESIDREIWNTIPVSAPMNGITINAVIKIAMRIMYEALTEAQDKP